MVAAATLDPGVYFAMNVGPGEASPRSQPRKGFAQWGLIDHLNPSTNDRLAEALAASLSRTGGRRPCCRHGGHHGNVFSGAGLALKYWYHFAIMFEAVFILTTIDAGTRSGGSCCRSCSATSRAAPSSWYPSILYLLGCRPRLGLLPLSGRHDPLGGINSLWPLFGIANQLLAAVALCVATTALAKMGKLRYPWVPLCHWPGWPRRR